MHDDHVKRFLNRSETPLRREETVEVVPALPGDGKDYQPHARASNEPVYSLHCLRGAAGCRSFQYVHLDSGSSFTAERSGQVIALCFSGAKSIAVTIHGRNLRNLYDYIHQHRIAWISQLDNSRDFGADGDTVITAIDVAEVNDDADEFARRVSPRAMEVD